MLEKIDLAQAFGTFDEHWSPRLAGTVDHCHIKLVKFQGEFVWHSHKDEDEMFLVVKGSFVMRLRDGEVEVSEGQFLIVPKGVEHQPFAEFEVWVLLFEPSTTINTGSAGGERTRTVEPL